MADDNNNLQVVVDGNEQAIIGTDVYYSSGSGETAHAQVMKVAWGNDSTVTRATEQTPLPVKVFGLTGPLGTVTVTGAVRGLGTFNVGNTSGSAIHVTGGVNAFVYGVTGATPVAVTGSVSISSSVGITGVVNVTGGRYLNSATDSIMVSGTLAKSWNLTNANDNITVYGVGGATFLSSKIMGSDGTIIGNSGGALNVNLVGAGISATVNVGTVIGVENATGGVLRIEGTAGGTPVPVSGTVSVSSLPDISITNSVITIDAEEAGPGITYHGGPGRDLGFSNLERLLISRNGSNNHTIATWAQYIWGSLGEAYGYGPPLSPANSTIQGRLRAFDWDSRGATGQGVRTYNATRNPIKTWRVAVPSSSSTPALLDPDVKSATIKHGVTIKNISASDVIIGAGVVNSGNYVAPIEDADFGIHLSSGESIFIPNSIHVSTLVSDGIPPLYAKTTGSTGTVSIMAV